MKCSRVLNTKAPTPAARPTMMAKRAITYRYGDLWLDFPELDVENPDEYEILQEDGTVRFLGRWKGMKSYTVRLNENGAVLQCDEYDSDAQEARPDPPSEEVLFSEWSPEGNG